MQKGFPEKGSGWRLTNAPSVWYDKQQNGGPPVFRESLLFCGEMSERLKEPVLKTGDASASVGSNPTLSASLSAPYAEVPKWPKGLPC